MDCMTVAHNFALHWTGSSRFSLFQCSTQWRLLPASELQRYKRTDRCWRPEPSKPLKDAR